MFDISKIEEVRFEQEYRLRDVTGDNSCQVVVTLHETHMKIVAYKADRSQYRRRTIPTVILWAAKFDIVSAEIAGTVDELINDEEIGDEQP